MSSSVVRTPTTTSTPHPQSQSSLRIRVGVSAYSGRTPVQFQPGYPQNVILRQKLISLTGNRTREQKFVFPHRESNPGAKICLPPPGVEPGLFLIPHLLLRVTALRKSSLAVFFSPFAFHYSWISSVFTFHSPFSPTAHHRTLHYCSRQTSNAHNSPHCPLSAAEEGRSPLARGNRVPRHS